MGRIHILADQVANQIAAGEVVDRPASVVKELLENSLDAGATRIVIAVEGGGRKLIRIADDGSGMVRDDALLAFERHATSKLRSSDDLLSIATLGFRGEALPSIASIARVEMVTRAAGESSGTRMEIAGGKLLLCEDAGAPPGTTLTVRDLFFNTPARRKFLKSETTELAHVTALVTHYALAHPDKHFELHSATHALLVAPPVRQAAERIFQIFGQDTLDQLLPLAAEIELARAGLPEPPPWRRPADYQAPEPGWLRISGFTSKPELRKTQSQLHLLLRQSPPGARPLAHACGERGLPQYSCPHVFSRGAAVCRDAAGGGGCQRPPGQDRSAFPPGCVAARLCARHHPQQTDPRPAGGGFFAGAQRPPQRHAGAGFPVEPGVTQFGPVGDAQFRGMVS